MQTVTLKIIKQQQFKVFPKKIKKSEKEKLEPKKTNKTKTVQNINSIDCSKMKIEVL